MKAVLTRGPLSLFLRQVKPPTDNLRLRKPGVLAPFTELEDPSAARGTFLRSSAPSPQATSGVLMGGLPSPHTVTVSDALGLTPPVKEKAVGTLNHFGNVKIPQFYF